MASNILQAINELTTAIQSLQTTINVNPLIDVSPVCCDDITVIYEEQNYYQITVGTGDPPAPYVDWPTYESDLCKRAWTAVLQVEQAMNGIYDIAGGGVGIAVGVIIAVLAIISAPYLIALEVLAVLTGGGFVVSITLLRQYLTDIQDELVCAIYTAETVEEAASNIGAVLLSSQLDPASITILTLTWHRGLLNSVFDGTLAISPTVPTDCSFCESMPGCPGCLSFPTTVMGFVSSPLYPGAAQVSWNAAGSPNPGSVEIELNANFEVGRAHNEWCSGFVVQSTDVISCKAYYVQGTETVNLLVGAKFTDTSGFNANVQGVNVGGWYDLSASFGGANAGKTIDYVFIEVNRALNQEQKIARFDEVCITRP